MIIDSNLLLLLAVGLWNPRGISTQKRLGDSKLNAEDFEMLRTFLSSFNRIVTTAHVLTEVSNLAGSSSGQTKDAIFVQLASLIQTLDERTVPASAICTGPEFRIFGLTDTALSVICSDMILLTQDGRLASHLRQKGLSVLSLNDLRSLRDQANDA